MLTLAYLVAGMSVYDAAAHSLTTVSTGGFSPHTESMAFFQSGLIEWIAIIGMFIAGCNFTMLYKLLRRNPAPLRAVGRVPPLCASWSSPPPCVVMIASDGVPR